MLHIKVNHVHPFKSRRSNKHVTGLPRKRVNVSLKNLVKDLSDFLRWNPVIETYFESVAVEAEVFSALVHEVGYVSVENLKVTDGHGVVAHGEHLRVVDGDFLHYALYGAYAHVIANPERSCSKEEKPSDEVPEGF